MAPRDAGIVEHAGQAVEQVLATAPSLSRTRFRFSSSASGSKRSTKALVSTGPLTLQPPASLGSTRMIVRSGRRSATSWASIVKPLVLISTTVVSKNADIPNLNIQEIPQSPTATQWRLGPDHKEGLETSPKRSLPAGCEGVVSPLVKHEVRRVPGLCLVSTDGIPHA